MPVIFPKERYEEMGKGLGWLGKILGSSPEEALESAMTDLASPMPLITRPQLYRGALKQLGSGLGDFWPSIRRMVEKTPKKHLDPISEVVAKDLPPGMSLGTISETYPGIKGVPEGMYFPHEYKRFPEAKARSMFLKKGAGQDAAVRTPFHETAHDLYRHVLPTKNIEELEKAYTKIPTAALFDLGEVLGISRENVARYINPEEIFAEAYSEYIAKRANLPNMFHKMPLVFREAVEKLFKKKK